MDQSSAIQLEKSKVNDWASTDVNCDDSTEECKSSSSSSQNEGTLLYGLQHKPSTILSILLALQVIIIVSFSVMWLPLSITRFLCIHPDDPARTEIASLFMFSSGLSTLLFSSTGLRLPVLMLPNVNYMHSMINILKLPELKCPGAGDLYAMGHENRQLEWQTRLKFFQGGILIITFLQFIFGITGIIGLFDRMLSNPLVLIPTTIIIGFSYANEIMNLTITSDISMETNPMTQWGVLFLTVGIIIITGFKFQNIEFSLPSYTHKDGFGTAYLKLFRMFPVFVASFIVLIIHPCILNLMYGKNENEKMLLKQSFENSGSYFIHTPFMYGWPSFHPDAFLLLIPAATIQIIQSILIYRVTNFVYGQNVKRKYINQGISMESLSSFIAGIFGATTVGSPVNIGIMQLTGVGSRRVIQLSGVLLILFSISASLLKFLVAISPAFILSVLYVISGTISVTGLSMAQRINMNSIRSCTVIGLALYSAIVIPNMAEKVSSESKVIQIFAEIFSSNVIICVLFASVLNAILPRNGQSDVLEEPASKNKKKEKQGLSFCEELFAICL